MSKCRSGSTAVVSSADLVALAAIKVFRSKASKSRGHQRRGNRRYRLVDGNNPMTTASLTEMGKTAIQLLEQLWALRKVNEPQNDWASLVAKRTTRRI